MKKLDYNIRSVVRVDLPYYAVNLNGADIAWFWKLSLAKKYIKLLTKKGTKKCG